MAATPSISITKSLTYRGETREYTNRYHFLGGTPADAAHWTTLANAVIAAEKTCYTADTTVVGWKGYAAGSDVPVASGVVSVVGTKANSGSHNAPGDCCVLLRFQTAARSSKNHPVYLYNYLKRAVVKDSGGGAAPDDLEGAQKTIVETYGTAWLTGFSDGTNTYVRAGPNGAAATSRTVSQYVHHRDFPN